VKNFRGPLFSAAPCTSRSSDTHITAHCPPLTKIAQKLPKNNTTYKYKDCKSPYKNTAMHMAS